MNAQESIVLMHSDNPMTSKRRGKPVGSFSNRTKLEDQRVSVCNSCFRGIFRQQEYSFSNRGYIHNSCKDSEEDETEIIT
jgi:hypothetical protein